MDHLTLDERQRLQVTADHRFRCQRLQGGHGAESAHDDRYDTDLGLCHARRHGRSDVGK